MKLYQITESLRQLGDRILEADAEIDQATLAELEAVEAALEDKTKNIVSLIREWEAEAETATAESRRIAEIAGRRKRAADRLRAYLVRHLQSIDCKRVITPIGTVSVCKSSRPSIAWTGDGEIPEQFRRVKTELDGTAAYDAFKREELPAGFSVTFSNYLRVM